VAGTGFLFQQGLEAFDDAQAGRQQRQQLLAEQHERQLAAALRGATAARCAGSIALTNRPRASTWRRASASSRASTSTLAMRMSGARVRTANCMGATGGKRYCELMSAFSPAPPGWPSLPSERIFVLGLGARRAVLVGVAPRIGRDTFLQVRAVPFAGGRGWRGQQRVQALFGRRVAADVEAVGVERFFEGLDLGLGDGDFGFAQLREILGPPT
jgi:hypothetical protein